VNDVYIIKGIELYPDNTITILNRWGNIIYKVDNYDNVNNVWNGKSSQGVRFGGDDLPEGTYFYILDLKNGEKARTGYIYLNKAVK
jgi:gliding motility-associated-like protein